MITLALDPGRCTGWAVFDGEKLLESGTFGKESLEVDTRKYLKDVADLLNIHWPDRVVYEDAILVSGRQGYRAIARTRILIEAAVSFWDNSGMVPVYTIFPANWRSYHKLGRKQNKSLSIMVASAIKSETPDGDDEAEAILLGFAWIVTSGPSNAASA